MYVIRTEYVLLTVLVTIKNIKRQPHAIFHSEQFSVDRTVKGKAPIITALPFTRASCSRRVAMDGLWYPVSILLGKIPAEMEPHLKTYVLVGWFHLKLLAAP